MAVHEADLSAVIDGVCSFMTPLPDVVTELDLSNLLESSQCCLCSVSLLYCEEVVSRTAHMELECVQFCLSKAIEKLCSQ